MNKTAETAYPIHDLIAQRWSPRSFEQRAVEPEKIGSLLEAARWAASCYNEQPWGFLVATRDDEEGFARLAACLKEGNSWAARAPLLLLSTARMTFSRNDQPNRHAYHDVGLAVGNLTIQATALGLSVHQMAGFDRNKASETLGLPPGVDPVAMLAVGYRGEPDALPEHLAERERIPRTRADLGTFVFGPGWGRAWPVAKNADSPLRSVPTG